MKGEIAFAAGIIAALSPVYAHASAASADPRRISDAQVAALTDGAYVAHVGPPLSDPYGLDEIRAFLDSLSPVGFGDAPTALAPFAPGMAASASLNSFDESVVALEHAPVAALPGEADFSAALRLKADPREVGRRTRAALSATLSSRLGDDSADSYSLAFNFDTYGVGAANGAVSFSAFSSEAGSSKVSLSTNLTRAEGQKAFVTAKAALDGSYALSDAHNAAYALRAGYGPAGAAANAQFSDTLKLPGKTTLSQQANFAIDPALDGGGWLAAWSAASATTLSKKWTLTGDAGVSSAADAPRAGLAAARTGKGPFGGVLKAVFGMRQRADDVAAFESGYEYLAPDSFAYGQFAISQILVAGDLPGEARFITSGRHVLPIAGTFSLTSALATMFDSEGAGYSGSATLGGVVHDWNIGLTGILREDAPAAAAPGSGALAASLDAWLTPAKSEMRKLALQAAYGAIADGAVALKLTGAYDEIAGAEGYSARLDFVARF